jgi:outer membrane receptor protein involved in Fe transport
MTQSVNNPFLPASLASQMQAAGVSTFNMGSFLGDLGNGGQLGTQHPDTGRQVARFAFGFTGDFDLFGKNYTWDADTTYGWSTQNVTNPGTIFVPNFRAAAFPTRNAAGQIVCANATNAMAGCVPFNVFGLGVNTPAAVQYLEGEGQGPWQDARLHQFVTSANIKGSPFDDWAGPVSFATGIEHREEGAHVQADPYETLPSNWSLGIGPAWAGQFQVTEGYIETNVPLLKDLPFAESANIDAAFRETGYSTFGKVSTWKVGGTYSPGFGLTFRATRSADIREPTLVDLYSAGTSTTNSVNDPFNNNATILYRQTTTGNANLQPEDANNTIIGGVYQPTFIPRLNLSADYYNVNITHAISSSGLTAQNIINLCYNGNSSACSLFQRVGTGATQQLNFTIAPLNLASEHQNRMEFEASYSLPLDSFKQSWLQGDLNFNANVTHYMNDTQSSGVPGLPPTYLAGVDGSSTGLPKWKYSATMTWQLDPVSVSLTGRGLSSGVYATNYIACTSGCPTSTPFSPTYSTNHIDGAFYLDLAANYNFGFEGSKDQIYFNVRNLLDKDPPLVAQGSSTGYDFFPANAALYDILGRVMRVGVRFSM